MEDSNKDRRELLKIKQNPEAFEENCFRAAKEKYMKPISRVENFFYYFKWILLIGAIAAVMVVFMIIQTVSREPEDMRVMLVSYDHAFTEYEEPLEKIFEERCTDIDSDGTVNVFIQPIDFMMRGTGSQYEIAESERFRLELEKPASQIIISDEEFYEYADTGDEQSLEDLSEVFPEDALFNKFGVRACKLMPDIGLPDNVIIYVRAPLSNFNNSEEAAKFRAASLDILRKMSNG